MPLRLLTPRSLFFIWLIALCFTGMARADEPPALAGQWSRRVTALGNDKPTAAAVGFPENKSEPAVFTSAQPVPAGVYELEFDAASSHVGDAIAWNGGLSLREPASLGGAEFPAIQFGKPGAPQRRSVLVVHPKAGPFRAVFAAAIRSADMPAAFTRRISDKAPTGSKGKSKGPLDMGADASGAGLDLAELSPATHFYFLIDNLRLRPVSDLGYPASLTVPAIRYLPGQPLSGSVELASFEGKSAEGELSLFLENNVQNRVLVKKIPVAAFTGKCKIDFSITLPREELGYALIASFAKADGSQAASRSEYFTVAENFYRVAIHYSGVMGRNKLQIDENELRAAARKIRENYANCFEIFAWAQEDMVGMSPEQDVWFSGQTCYQISKPYTQAMIRASHEAGISAVTYGKFIMSGYLGWKTAWDRPLDHRAQFEFPVGMWDGTNERELQVFRYGEFIPEYRPDTGGAFSLGRPGFIPVNPDPTPAMARVAAENIIKSIKMFGWDGVRWDGHPRGDNLFAGQLGGPGKLDPNQARKTQALVKLIKDIVAREVPNARWGYNYLFTQNKPTHDWGVQDYELDELCADGGLVMNESIRKSHGQPFSHIAENLQVEGDLARERGGYLLCISCDEVAERDSFIEAIMYYAGGVRPYGAAAGFADLNRYTTRYGCYTLDERLRRLASPEAVIKPAAATPIWWTPFVYETPRDAAGKSQLVVNLLNIPYKDPVLFGHDKNASLKLNLASEPVAFNLSLPPGYSHGTARLIDPFTLRVSELRTQGHSISVPAVPLWSVLVVDLSSDEKTARLAEQFGPPVTFNKVRPGLKDVPRIALDPGAPPRELWKQMLAATQSSGWTGAQLLESPEFAAKPLAERNAELLKNRETDWHKPEMVLKSLYSSETLKPDFAIKEQAALPAIELSRNGKLDVFLGCGVLTDRLRMPEALASFPRFSLRTGDIWGGRGNYGMSGLSPGQLPQLDVCVFHDVPAGAIGAGNNYALLRWIKGGGGALFTGGPFSFGKGAYLHTILDRELLPVQVGQQLDIKYIPDGAAVEPGPDFEALGLPTSVKEELLKIKPVFWAFNEVAIRPETDVKIFLKAGNRPILVGRQLGEGRVACLLAATMGTSENGQTALAEWARWPDLLAGTLRWLSPRAGDVTPAREPDAKARDQAVQTLDDKRMDRLIDTGLESPKNAANSADKAQSAAAIRTLLTHGSGHAGSAGALVDQLGADTSLSASTAEEIIRFLTRTPAPNAKLIEAARRCNASSEPAIQSLGQQALALAGAPEFKNSLRPAADSATGLVPQARWGTMIGLALYQPDDLIALGEARCEAWQALCDKRFKQYTGGKGYSAGFPPIPLLDSDSLLERAAWMGYLARKKPTAYSASLMREWLQLFRYADYCDQTTGVLNERAGKGAPAQAGPLRVRAAQAQELKRYYLQLAALLAPQVREAFAKFPAEAAGVVADTFARCEVEHAMNLLGDRVPGDCRAVLEQLASKHHPHLGDFAARRIRE